MAVGCKSIQVRRSAFRRAVGQMGYTNQRDSTGRFVAAAAVPAVVVTHTRQQKRHEARQAAKKGGSHANLDS